VSDDEKEEYRKILDTILNCVNKENFQNIPEAIKVLQKHPKFFDFWLVVYVICKISQPKIVLETGVDEGYSTYAILKNLIGKLYSIDNNPNSGWLINNNNNWDLVIGRTENELYPLLEKIKKFDLICHDSAHNNKNQYDEYKIMWPYLKNEGIFISDDLTDAFEKFTKEMRKEIKDIFIIGNKPSRLIGIIVKK
jgi:hypothetical protein